MSPSKAPLTRREFWKIAVLFCAGMTVTRFLLASLLPAVQDEAYYFLWGQSLQFGYFDHPPGVALMASTSQFLEGNVLVARLGTIITAALLSLAASRLVWMFGLRKIDVVLSAQILINGSLIAMIGGFVTTPDTILLLFWTLALGESVYALHGKNLRWLSCGLFTGLGMLSKFTMVILFPILLWGMWKYKKLRSTWAWSGGLLAFLVFAPNFIWNANNEWITYKFQLRHGFSMDRPESLAYLPEPLPEIEGSEEANLADMFAELEEATEEVDRAPAFYDPLLKSLNRYFGYYGAQVGFWGLLCIPLFAGFKRKTRLRVLMLEHRPYLVVATIMPLLFFGSISLFGKAEANWSAMYVVSGAVFLAPMVSHNMKWLTVATATNFILLLIVTIHAANPFVPVRPHKDRVLKETHGYQSLAHHLNGLDQPVFAETYQLVSMVRFYQPGLEVRQWPGITRYSEFTRSEKYTQISMEKLISYGRFALVSTDSHPPRIEGFVATDLTQLRDCRSSELQIIGADSAQEIDSRCREPVHEWYLIQYNSI